MCGRKDVNVNEKFQWYNRESNPQPPYLYRNASTNYAAACPQKLLRVEHLISIWCQISSRSQTHPLPLFAQNTNLYHMKLEGGAGQNAYKILWLTYDFDREYSFMIAINLQTSL